MPSTTTTTAAAAPQNERQTEAALENEQRTEQQDGSDSDWDMDPTAPDTRAWVSKNNKKKEIIPPSTYSNGNMVKIVVHGVARTTGTITRKAWSSNRREWDYEVQTLDGGKSWKVEDELEPVMERRR